MLSLVAPIASLLLGLGILLAGNGLLGTLLGVRASVEGFSQVAIGFVMTSYFVGYLLGTFAVPSLVERFGHVRAYAALAAAASTGTLLHGFFVEPVAWALLRGAVGFFQVGIYMVVESWLNARADAAERGRTFSVYTMVSLGAFAAGQYLILVADPGSFEPFALVSMLYGVGLIPIALTRVPEPARVPGVRLEARRLFEASPLGFLGALASGLNNAAFWGMAAVFAQKSGFGVKGVAVFMSGVILGGAVFQPLIGWLSDRCDRRKVLTGVTSAGAVLGALTFFAVDHGLTTVTAFACLYGGTAFAVYPLSVVHANDHVGPGDVLATARGLLFFNGVGSAIGPFVAGLAMDAFGPPALFLQFAAVLAALTAIALFRMTRRAAVPVDEQGPFVSMMRTTPVVLEMLSGGEADP